MPEPTTRPPFVPRDLVQRIQRRPANRSVMIRDKRVFIGINAAGAIVMLFDIVLRARYPSTSVRRVELDSGYHPSAAISMVRIQHRRPAAGQTASGPGSLRPLRPADVASQREPDRRRIGCRHCVPRAGASLNKKRRSRTAFSYALEAFTFPVTVAVDHLVQHRAADDINVGAARFRIGF